MGRYPVYDLQQIRDLAGQGLTHREIAKAVGCSPTTVNNLLTPGAYERHLERGRAYRARRKHHAVDVQDEDVAGA